MVYKRIDQRTVGVARRGVHHQTFGFIDYHEAIILVGDIQRDILCRRLRRNRYRQCHGIKLSGNSPVTFSDLHAVSGDESLLQEPGRRTAAHPSVTGKESVDTLAALLCRDTQDAVHF